MIGNRVLVVDDEKLVQWSLARTLTEAGYLCETAATGAEARKAFRAFGPDLVLLDVRLPDADGMDLLKDFKAVDQDLLVLMITAYADADSAVKALKLGADDYIGKPFDLDKIRHMVKQAFDKRVLKRRVQDCREELPRRYEYDNLIGNSPGMIEVFKMIKLCADTDTKTVLILGESGTGKELVARAVHYHSARAKAPFIEVNCAAIPEHLLENELFGHEKGAFTDAGARHRGIFEAAEGGTVFLDEIGDMPLPMQAKVLRFLDTKRYRRLGSEKDREANVRIIAATNQDLPALANEGRFRADLFFRLNVMTITLPPLRERKEDIPALVNYFLQCLNSEYGRSVEGVAPETMQFLLQYPWPGNVRELKNALERAMMMETGNLLRPTSLNYEIRSAEPSYNNGQGGPRSGSPPERPADPPAPAAPRFRLPPEGVNLEEVERSLIEQALEAAGGNQTRAAKLLGLTRDTLRYRMKKFHLFTRARTRRGRPPKDAPAAGEPKPAANGS